MALSEPPPGSFPVNAVTTPMVTVQVPAMSEGSFNDTFRLLDPATRHFRRSNVWPIPNSALTNMFVAIIKYPSVQATLKDKRWLATFHGVHGLLESGVYHQIVDEADPMETHVDLSGPYINVVCKAVTVIMKHIQRSHDARTDPTQKA